MSDSLPRLIDEILPEVVDFRRDLHAHPELSRQEHETARKIRERLAKLPGFKILPPFSETDVVALLNADKDGPCLALRADMDALPMHEETDPAEVPYRSTVDGVMHACGHDGHVANLLGTAMVLSKMADELPGKVLFIFQPDEEDQGGARLLCERGTLDVVKVDGIVALHGWPMVEVGKFALRYGPAMASNLAFFITVRGRGSHGAYPHRSIDPITVAAHIVTGLQSIVSRTINPLDSAVLTVGAIHAGVATNVIPPECKMLGTLRFFTEKIGQEMRDRLCRIAEHTAQAHGATVEITFQAGYPFMANEENMARLIETTAKDLFGADCINTSEPPSMGVEDFAFYAQQVPAAMFRLGTRPTGVESCPALHHPGFNFNDDALPYGIRMFCELTRRFLAQHG